MPCILLRLYPVGGTPAECEGSIESPCYCIGFDVPSVHLCPLGYRSSSKTENLPADSVVAAVFHFATHSATLVVDKLQLRGN